MYHVVNADTDRVLSYASSLLAASKRAMLFTTVDKLEIRRDGTVIERYRNGTLVKPVVVTPAPVVVVPVPQKPTRVIRRKSGLVE